MQLSGKRVVVIGLGKSGLSAARLCRERGANVLAIDAGESSKLLEATAELDVEVRLGDVEARDALDADLVVVSPGVPRLSVLGECESKGISVIGELELGCRFVDAPILAVGGTNGKSTTSKLAFEMLTRGGRRAFIGANYGTPVCDAVGGGYDVLVLEVSSFQLERVDRFHPHASILLNISEDHLDRYDGFADYAAAKGNAFARQTAHDIAVFEDGDRASAAQAARGNGRPVRYGRSADADYRLEEARLIENKSGRALDLAGTRLHGRHNWLNLAAAVAAVRHFDVEWEAIEAAVRDFQPLAHRMARVAVAVGVAYYDDSKATNVGAAVTALSGLAESKAVLIAGGRDKQGSYEPLVAALRERGRALVCLGEAAGKIAEAAKGAVPVVTVTSMQSAVETARSLARPGDAVLLSPACSSFDMYESYAQRGDDFAREVLALTESEPQSP